MSVVKTGAQGVQEVLRFPVRLLTAILISNLMLSGLFAQGNSASNSQPRGKERADQVRALNNSVLRLHEQLQQNAADTATIHGQAATVLAQRSTALLTLIQEDPHTALSFSFSADLLADLAAKFPNTASYLESHITVTGPVEHWVMDSPDLKTSQESWVMNAAGNRLTLHFSKTEVPNFHSGPNVTIEGVRLGSDVAVSKIHGGTGAALTLPSTARSLAVSQGFALLSAVLLAIVTIIVLKQLKQKVRSLPWVSVRGARQLASCALALFMVAINPFCASAQSSCSTTGEQNVAVLIVNFQDAQVAVTPQQVNNVFFDTSSGHSLNGYWQEASYGQTWATGSVFGPYTLGSSTSYTCVNISQIFYDAVAAANASGVNLQGYTRINIVFPGLSCGWAGVTSTGSAGAGCSTWNTAEGTLTASVSFLISSYLTTRDQGVILAAHENGHQLGLDHAGTVTDQPTAVLGPSGSPGTIGEFNDFFSAMGAWTLATYSVEHKSEILKWMASGPNYQLVQSSGTYTLQPLETNPPALQGLKIQRNATTGEYLWVEYRQPIGNYDSTIGFMNFGGALIHYQSPTTGKHTNVMDFTASDVGSWYNTVLGPGQTWTDAYSNVSLTVQGATANGLTLSVNYGSGGSTSCVSASPTVNVAPLNPSIYAGQTASYSISVTNNDSPGCPSSTVNLASSEPSGWSTNLSSSAVSLAPGQSASIGLGKGAPVATPAGTYAVNLTATTSSSNMTDTANATVVAAPSLSASLNVAGATFSRPGSVPISATVLNLGLPASGASVTFAVVSPNGATSTQSATTNSSGIASWSYKLNQKSQAGTYSVTAKASLSSGSRKGAATQSVSSAAATFSVQ